jgi:hypothetical protein
MVMNCASRWSFTKNLNMMHGQQNERKISHIFPQFHSFQYFFLLITVVIDAAFQSKFSRPQCCVAFMCSNIIAQFMITLESFVISVQDVE